MEGSSEGGAESRTGEERGGGGEGGVTGWQCKGLVREGGSGDAVVEGEVGCGGSLNQIPWTGEEREGGRAGGACGCCYGGAVKAE